MRRRLDLAVSLIATPPIIFLDESTTGLDPRSRIAMWEIIEQLKANGATQYLEEADQLADKIVVIDGGKVIAEGAAKELKARVGKDRLELTSCTTKAHKAAVKILGKSVQESNNEEKSVTIVLNDTNADVRKVLDMLAK